MVQTVWLGTLCHMLQVCHEISSWYICMTQGLVSHAPGVSGLSSTITLVQIIYPRAFCCTLQVYLGYHQLSPWQTIQWNSPYHTGHPCLTISRTTRATRHRPIYLLYPFHTGWPAMGISPCHTGWPASIINIALTEDWTLGLMITMELNKLTTTLSDNKIQWSQ